MYSKERQIDTKELRKSMIDQGFDTDRDAAKAAGISENSLRRVLKRGEQPSAAIMYAIADVLDLSPEEAGRVFFKRLLHNK